MPGIPNAQGNGVLIYLHRNPFALITPYIFYTKHLLHQIPLLQTPVTPDNFYNKQLLRQAALQQTTFTPGTFTPETFYTKNLLH